jgi:glucose/arabinose dehydrogenase
MKKFLAVFCALFVTIIARAAQLPSGFSETLLAQNLDPTDMVMTPDGRILITIKSGRIVVVQNGVLLPTNFLTLAVDNFNERGLGHIVLDPNFETNNFYYVYYTVPGQNRNRVSRFTANGNSTLAGSEVVLLDLDLLSGTIHNAGAMVFGVDGKLYVSTGDGANAATSQSMNSLLGKVLRINTDPANLIPTLETIVRFGPQDSVTRFRCRCRQQRERFLLEMWVALFLRKSTGYKPGKIMAGH